MYWQSEKGYANHQMYRFTACHTTCFRSESIAHRLFGFERAVSIVWTLQEWDTKFNTCATQNNNLQCYNMHSTSAKQTNNLKKCSHVDNCHHSMASFELLLFSGSKRQEFKSQCTTWNTFDVMCNVWRTLKIKAWHHKMSLFKRCSFFLGDE